MTAGGAQARGADGSGTVEGQAGREAQHEGVAKVLAKCKWLTGIRFLDEEINDDDRWEAYEEELASLLGVDGGAEVVRVRAFSFNTF